MTAPRRSSPQARQRRRSMSFETFRRWLLCSNRSGLSCCRKSSRCSSGLACRRGRCCFRRARRRAKPTSCSGRLGVFVAAEAELIPVAQISPGEIVGEMSLISGRPRSATVLALRDSEAVRLPCDAVALLMDAHPQFGFFVMRLLAARLKERTRTRLLRQTIDAIAIISLTEPLPDSRFPERLARVV